MRQLPLFNPLHFFCGAVVLTASTAALCGAELQPLSLEAAIAEAVSQNPALRVIDADVEAARGAVLTSQEKPPLELTAGPGWKRTNEGDGAKNQVTATVELQKTFLSRARRELVTLLAERDVELRQLATEGLRFELGAAVRLPYYELLAAQSILALRQEQLASAQAFQTAVAQRAAAGFTSDFEATKSTVEVLNATKQLRAAEAQIAIARVELNTLLGRDPSISLVAAGSLSSASPDIALPGLLARALSVHPGFRVLAKQTEIAELTVRKAGLARKPDLSAGPSLELSRTEQVLGFSATIPLPDKNYGRGALQTASAERRKLQAEEERLRRQITADVTVAAANYTAARAQLALYTPTYLDQLKAMHEQAERTYNQNATSLLIYLDAKRTYYDALADYYDALGEAARSRAALEAVAGVSLENLNP
jgi:outer membrane protein TolC